MLSFVLAIVLFTVSMKVLMALVVPPPKKFILGVTRQITLQSRVVLQTRRVVSKAHTSNQCAGFGRRDWLSCPGCTVVALALTHQLKQYQLEVMGSSLKLAKGKCVCTQCTGSRRSDVCCNCHIPFGASSHMSMGCISELV